MFNVVYFVCACTSIWLLSSVLPLYIIKGYTCVGCVLLTFSLIHLLYPYFKSKFRRSTVSPHSRAVLITGCDSGFGHELAKRLDSRGFHVFASCLFPDGQGAETLKKSCSGRLQVLGLDVTKDDSVAQAVQFVKENMNAAELWAVVNNAGIHQGFDVDWSHVEHFKRSFDVNSLGPVRVTKAFLPMLRSSRGRVVTVASISGRLAVPHVTPYEISKFAAAAFSDCLKLELEPWGIRVISIEPELFSTPITNSENVKKNLKAAVDMLDEDTKMDYGEQYFKSLEKYLEFYLKFSSGKVHIVIDSIESAVCLKDPQDIYRPCRNFLSYLVVHTLLILPASLRESVVRAWDFVTGFPTPNEAGTTF